MFRVRLFPLKLFISRTYTTIKLYVHTSSKISPHKSFEKCKLCAKLRILIVINFSSDMFLRCPKRQKRVLPLQSNVSNKRYNRFSCIINELQSSDDPKSIYEFKVKDLDRNEVCLEQFRYVQFLDI